MEVPGTVITIESLDKLNALFQREAASTHFVLFLWADFHELSRPGGQMDVMFTQLAAMNHRVKFVKICADEAEDIAELYEISVVPTFVFTQGQNKIDKLEGANVAELAKRVDLLNKSALKSAATASTTETSTQENGSSDVDDAMKQRLHRLINASSVMLFMKGNPKEPKCGFSRQMVALLNEEKIQYGTFDILNDQEVRQSLKQYSNWPTYPQLYVHGNLVGGLDILREMKEDGDLPEQLGLREEIEEAEKTLNENLKELINSAPIILFMKGNPKEPKCGFSRQTVQLLREHQVPFSTFDILSDDEVRQGLKVFSNWPTYPQLYVNGNLIGGLDIITEMAEDGNLAEQFGVEKRDKPVSLEERLAQLIRRSPVMMFMKGDPSNPQCGFSRTMVGILQSNGFEFDTFDILSDDKVRQGLKKFSNWPTYPQLYINGELIGGLDIVKELQDDGELADLKP